MKYGAEHRQAIAAGCLRADRSRTARARYARVVAALIRIGHHELLTRHIRESVVMTVLHGLAAATEPEATDGAAIRATLARTPRAFTMFLRRNTQFVQDQIAAAEQDNAPVP